MIIQPVILAGGSGTRLWPLSRELYPKQFLAINSDQSLLQQTLTRIRLPVDPVNDLAVQDPIIICNEEHRFLVAEQARNSGINPEMIILEPVGRNTAPALTCAALLVSSRAPETILLMMPADHIVNNQEQFNRTVTGACLLAEQDKILTFGVIPDRPETGYGYIRKGTAQKSVNRDVQAFQLAEFVEKPDADKAAKYIKSGKYLWNSGLFMMQASTWLSAIEKFRPDILASCQNACSKGSRDDSFFRLEKYAFTACPSDSVDYAVMEKLADQQQQAIVVSLDAGWSDIGSWSSVFEHCARTEENNVLIGDVLQNETTDSLVKSDHRLVVTVGCSNIVVIETPDAVLVADKDKTQDVKNVVDVLKKSSREETITHRKVYRPWGSYESLDNGENYQVKRLTVNPGKKLSLQLHNRRAEHWVVVSGEATVTRGDETFVLSVNESTYIPVKTKHRLANLGNTPLEVIEVQSGDYLGEDDIIRFDDDFGRVTT